jgi:hypothetical protein
VLLVIFSSTTGPPVAKAAHLFAAMRYDAYASLQARAARAAAIRFFLKASSP